MEALNLSLAYVSYIAIVYQYNSFPINSTSFKYYLYIVLETKNNLLHKIGCESISPILFTLSTQLILLPE